MKPFASLLTFSIILFGTTPPSLATQQKLLPPSGQAGDNYGFGVSIDGSTALVGAHNADTNGIIDAGAAYVYTRGKKGWQQQAKLIVNPTFAHDTVGGNVALKGKDAGAVAAFERKGQAWSQTQIITAIDAKAGDAFGQSIALTERFLVIGAPHSDAPHPDSGSAYVYIRDKQSWKFHSKLTANDGAEGDLFGISVAIDADTILVGADLHNEKAENAGAVYAYVFDGKQWQHQAKLTAKDAGDTDIFGVRVCTIPTK